MTKVKKENEQQCAIHDLQNRKIEFNIDRFFKSRVTPKIYFKYFYEEPPIQKEFNFSYVQLPKVNRMCV